MHFVYRSHSPLHSIPAVINSRCRGGETALSSESDGMIQAGGPAYLLARLDHKLKNWQVHIPRMFFC